MTFPCGCPKTPENTLRRVQSRYDICLTCYEARQMTYKCGHGRTPANSVKTGQNFGCRICYRARKRAHTEAMGPGPVVQRPLSASALSLRFGFNPPTAEASARSYELAGRRAAV